MRMAELHADLDEQRQAEEWAEYLSWYEDERKLSDTQKGQPSPVNDGILKENENGLHRI